MYLGTNGIALCVEEMAGSTVPHRFELDKQNHLPIRIRHKGNRRVRRFRDERRAFAPVKNVPAGDRDALRIRLAMAMGDDIRCANSLNLNHLTIKLNESVIQSRKPVNHEKPYVLHSAYRQDRFHQCA